MTPWSVYSKDRTDESVEGIVLLRRGENPSRVLVKVKEAVQELNESELPKGVKITPFYDRQYLVDSTLHTVAHSVSLGITLVVLVLLLFLGRPSIAALVATTIPFSLLVALALMYLTDIPIGLLSIGAIDFGIIVDGAVIVAENIARRLGEATRQGEKGTVPICAKHPPGRSGKWGLSPFSPAGTDGPMFSRWCWRPRWKSSGPCSSRC